MRAPYIYKPVLTLICGALLTAAGAHAQALIEEPEQRPPHVVWEARHGVLADAGMRLKLIAAPRMLELRDGWVCMISSSRPRKVGGEQRSVRCDRPDAETVEFTLACGPDAKEKLVESKLQRGPEQLGDFIWLRCELVSYPEN